MPGPAPASAPQVYGNHKPPVAANVPQVPARPRYAATSASDYAFPVSYYANSTAGLPGSRPAVTATAPGTNVSAPATDTGRKPALVSRSDEATPKKQRVSLLSRLVARFQWSVADPEATCTCRCHTLHGPTMAPPPPMVAQPSIAVESRDVAKRGESVERVSAQRVDETAQR